jgi:diacylglycerol O-acyltransferase
MVMNPTKIAPVRSESARSVLPQLRLEIERASATDLMQLASDVPGSRMQVGVILVLGSGPTPDLPAVCAALAARIPAVPRLRQRLVRAPFGCGRPIWVDDPDFDIRRHVREVHCPAPGDEAALLAIAADMVISPLPRGRPLWSATVVAGLARNSAALVVVFHHVLADGIGGLAVLAQLVDGARAARVAEFPRPAPSRGRLCLDVWRSRLRAVAHLPTGVRLLRHAVAELVPHDAVRAPACSLNRPTGPRRSLAVVHADLADLRAAAHADGGTVNDVVLAAVTGALRSVLLHRGENVDRFVISVPVSARVAATATRLGNQVGVIPLGLPASGTPRERLAAIAAISRERKTTSPGASAALMAPAFRTLARLGLLRWSLNRQRLVSTLVTNLRGPHTSLSFLGAPVSRVIPLPSTMGNVTVAFGVLSYAGTLTVTVVADPGRCTDLPVLAEALQGELDALASGERSPLPLGK